MKYRTNIKNGDELSALGFGCMRLPRSTEETRALVTRAIDSGINYFDTAYIYPNNEVMLGRALEGKRERVKLATKLPPMGVGNREDLDRVFSSQLERLRTDYIDYYLIHMLTEQSTWERLKALGILEWIAEQKKLGRIINLGFSYHGGRAEFVKLIDAYDWDFCMIQFNYLDETNQAGLHGLRYAAERGIPVMIMEPLRGGRLADALPRDAREVFAAAEKKRSPADWGLRWIWNHPEVCVVLSGMSTAEMLDENVAAASDASVGDLTPTELEMFARVRKILETRMKIPCTGCNYCMPCPVGVDIPTCFSCYNERFLNNWMDGMTHYMMQTSFRKSPSNASQCIKCGKCESHCPQGIEIRRELGNVRHEFEKFFYKPMRAVVQRVMKMR